VTTLLLVRHGETDWNRVDRFQGHADPPLNDLGRDQARALAGRLAGVGLAAVYSSDLQRALETATILAEPHALDVSQRPGLREIDVGEWSGLTVAEIEDRYPDGIARHRDGGDGWTHGEPHARMQERIVAEALAIAASHPDEQVLVVLHGGTIRALLAAAEGLDFSEFRRARPGIANAGMATIAVEDGILRRLD
jgi:broad specificity phosphatase PhoE